jgi:hypothetical protein
MNETSIYINREDATKVEAEERDIYIKSILEGMGVPLDDVWPDTHLTVEQKIKLRELLSKLDLEIVEDGDRGYRVYSEGDLLAEWFKPRFVLRKDESARSNRNKLFYEMIVKTNDVFEGNEDE